MKITRDSHAHYMGKLAPLLLIAYVAQAWCYYHFVSPTLAYDISVFLGIGIVLIAGAFLAHDYCYEATLHANHLQLKLFPFPYKDEILFRDIEEVKVIPTRFSFSHLKLTTDEGKNIWLYNIDNAHEVSDKIKGRQKQ